MSIEPEFPGEVPTTVRFLNSDLDAALRVACTGVLRNNRPSHEYHKDGKAQLDYATVRRRGGNDPTPRKSEEVKSTLTKLRAERPNRDSVTLNRVMTPKSTERTFHMSALIDYQPQTQERVSQVQVQSSSAQSRDTQSMSGSPSKTSERQRQKTELQNYSLQHSPSPSPSQSTPKGFWKSLAPQLESELGSVR
jgi:hypothetical protein